MGPNEVSELELEEARERNAARLQGRLPDLERFKALNPKAMKSAGRRKYGITYQQWREMVEAQEGKCAICGDEVERINSLAVDHCHKTGRLRGLLCNRCNTGLGMFRDNPENLKRAITYLWRQAGEIEDGSTQTQASPPRGNKAEDTNYSAC